MNIEAYIHTYKNMAYALNFIFAVYNLVTPLVPNPIVKNLISILFHTHSGLFHKHKAADARVRFSVNNTPGQMISNLLILCILINLIIEANIHPCGR